MNMNTHRLQLRAWASTPILATPRFIVWTRTTRWEEGQLTDILSACGDGAGFKKESKKVTKRLEIQTMCPHHCGSVVGGISGAGRWR